ncbi:glycosyltransferase involved in cell wall biosynthesis [Algoriphagus sp. 4150]|uniref:glycosyltransferase family 4 protein n=1 Tax=Algoriphagus sp. 4150 TaxID=2817756 RepID=UPI0028585579|nr:glycosyltransferase family 4 protein [Algoriphagus sp. 4150]MDR7130547.1 glycosyltransferase involved in cell wall biosynthesis [Algoriphagus sp. 4150]
MKVLWVNPSFLDYRVPLYEELNNCFNGNFHVLFSKSRIPERVVEKVARALGANSYGLEGERFLRLGRQGELSNQGVQIPFQSGLLRAITEIKPDLIIGEGFFQWTPVVAYYARKRGIPFWIAYERTFHTERNCPIWRKIYRKVINRFVTGYLANGSLTAEYLKAEINTANRPIIEGCMSADGANLSSRVEGIKQKETKEVKGKGITYLFVGQLIFRKGILELCEAWTTHTKRFPEDVLLVIGDGDLRGRIQEIISSYSSVRILGSVDYDDIYQHYANADVFIMPTLEDNWSLVVPEAMACGLPVATTFYNGCYPELVKEGKNGKVFDSLNPESILEALEYFHSQDLSEMGKESVKIESNYSPKEVAQRIASAILAHKGNLQVK